jgi:hypothetical protein
MRQRGFLDDKRIAEQHDDNQWLMYAAALLVCVAMLGCLLLLVAAQLAAADEAIPEQPKQAHTCGNAASWVEWDELIAKNPNHMDLRALYALRVGLCVQVQQGKLTVDEGTAIFERARQALIWQAERPKAEGQSKL